MRELRSLLRAPYALIHIETHEEERAVDLIGRLVGRDDRPMWQWSATTGFGGEPSDGNLWTALEQIESSEEKGVFMFKDIQPLLEDSLLRRRLREVEFHCARNGKTLIFVGPRAIDFDEFAKDLTRLSMPLPDREVIRLQYEAIFPVEHFADLPHDILIAGALGLTQREAHRAFHRVRHQLLEARSKKAEFDIEESILREKQRLVGSSEALEFYSLAEGMQDVGGMDNLKQWLKERQKAFGEEARAYGLPAPKGLLLIGVQGCGKSLTAKAVARHWGLPLLRLDMGAVFDGKRSPEEALRRSLKTCDALAPCVLWLDEIEKGFAGSESDGRAVRVLGSLLTWQQEKTTPVFLVATANRVQSLPPELLRKGRFDEVFFVDLPDVHERRDILNIHLKKRSRSVAPELVEEVAEMCEHYSGAELEQVVIAAMYTAFADARELDKEELIFAVQETVPLYKTYEEQIKALREWAHERARPASRERRLLDYFGA
ncbi:MAG: AAA family ATPase [Bradymonadaceae bacterium]